MDVLSYCVSKNTFGTNCITQGDKQECVFRFFSVNPRFRPLPVGMTLFAIRNNTTNTLTQEVREVTDPYEKRSDCIYALVWVYDLPNTIPIYVAYSPFNFSVLVSLTPIPTGGSEYTQQWIWHVIDSKMGPNFQFASQQELCIPTSSGGTTLSACVLSNNVNPAILHYVGYFKKHDSISRPNSELYMVIILFVLIFFTFIIKYVLARFE